MEALVIFAIVAIIVFAFFNEQRKNEAATEAWGAFALAHGLEHTPKKWSVERRLDGQVRGFRVEACEDHRGSGKSRKRITRVQVHLNHPLGLGLELTQEHTLSGFAKFFGSQDIEVGDAGFDDMVMVKGAEPDRVREFLTPVRRGRIQRFFRAFGDGLITDEVVRREVDGMVSQKDDLARHFASLVSLARTLEGREHTQHLEVAVEAQSEGRIDEALEILDRSRASDEPSPAPDPLDEVERVDEDLLGGQILMMGGRTDEARTRFERAQSSLPGDPEVEGWLEKSRSPDPSPTPETGSAADAEGVESLPDAAEPVPEVVAEPLEIEAEAETDSVTESDSATEADAATETPKGPLAVAAICARLFDPAVMSFDAARIFETEYADCEVTWTGTLESVSPFTFDLVFGNEKGTRAVLQIHELATSSYASATIRAVAALAEDAEKELKPRVGSQVTVRGRLVKVDAFMRNLFLAEASEVTPPA